MIEWYKDNDLGIFFSEIPNVGIRFVAPNNSCEEVLDINNKPFINYSDLDVMLVNYQNYKRYEFKILKDYLWDGASIPRFCWQIVGSKTDNRFLIPSLIHDVLCENHGYVDNDREFSSKIFDCLLKVSKVNSFSRFLMFNSVNQFQKLQNWN